MKIAFFNYLMLENGGGTARFFIDVATGLKIKYPGLQIFILTFSKKLAKKVNDLYSLYFQRDVNLEFSTAGQDAKDYLSKRGISYIQAGSLSELRNLLSQFDAVYSKNDIVEAFILKFLVGKKYLKKTIFGFHTPLYYELTPSWQAKFHNFIYGSFFYWFLLKNADKFHVLNKFDERLLKKHFKDKTVKKIYNPFDFQIRNKSVKIFKKVSQENKKLHIIWVGRLTKEKGIDDLVSLITQVNKLSNSHEIQWQIAGAGEYEKEIKALSKSYKNVHYYGYLTNDRLIDLYKRSDLLLSTSKWETFPYTFLEAQSCGLPVISYNIHGCNEIVKEKVNGYLTNSLKEMKNRLTMLTAQKNELIKKSDVRKYISNMINNNQIYRQLYELFTKE